MTAPVLLLTLVAAWPATALGDPPTPRIVFESVVPAGRCPARLLDRGPIVHFELGAAALATDDETERALALAASRVAAVEGRVEVGVHTDHRGNDASNMALSTARAGAVVDALVARGVPAERLVAVGYGESRTVITNEGCDLSRRVELVALGAP